MNVPPDQPPNPFPTEVLASMFAGPEPTEVIAEYVWGARPGHRDELVRRDRYENGEPVERLYCLMDYFNPVAVIDAAGEVQERYAWSAFGLRTVLDPAWESREESAFAFDFGFHGQFLDIVTGYYNYGYRYYSPEIGRWLRRDPFGEKGGQNLLLVGGNNLVNLNDHLGLFAKYSDCCPCQEEALAVHLALSLDQIDKLIEEIDTAVSVPPSGTPRRTIRKLKAAGRKLKRTKERLPNLKIRCTCTEKAIASIPPGGRTISIHLLYWEYVEEVQAASLVHEATHSAALTTDAVYWWQDLGIFPDTERRGSFLQGTPTPSTFEDIASTYDTWIIFGFRFPSDSEIPLPERELPRSEMQCDREIQEHCGT